MTREIKFRGRSIKTGEFVYGDLIHPWAEDEKHMMIRVHLDYHETKDGTAICGNIPVEKDSVAQLIAVDKNGREVYEGDTVINIADMYGQAILQDEINKAELAYAASFKDFFEILDGTTWLFEEAA